MERGRAFSLLVSIALVGACGGRGCASNGTLPEGKTAAPAAQVDPALPGIGSGNAELSARLRVALKAKGTDYKPRTRHLSADGSPKYTNRLVLQTSPYLLQHAHNPVNWFPWDEEAFERARREGKPVLLSVGYSTCHWCHVMEHESFEDEEIARFINQHFIPIKVDREERPDVDDVYMKAVQMLTGGGGWPMTVVLTPDKQPFFGGTYFPARDGDRGSRKGFLTILRELAGDYETSRAGVVERARELSRRMQAAAAPQTPGNVPGPDAMVRAVQSMSRSFDPTSGGFGRAPKFPRPATLDLLLRYHRRTRDAHALEMVVRTLEGMARGGIYDYVGGGFHRYSTDARWLVPHFEKMLYDNAQLVAVYLAAYQVTGRQDFATVARETLDYVSREMTSPDGAFYSATDADSRTPSGHSEEGWFFTWTPGEIDGVLGGLSPTFQSIYPLTSSGNFEGRNILHRVRSNAEAAKEIGITEGELTMKLANARQKLYEVRSKRPPPLRDDKVLTSWNGLMISAFARGALVLGESSYRARAERAAAFILRELTDKNGELLRSYRDGRAKHKGYLDDHAFLIQGLLDLLDATSDPKWLENAKSLQATLDRGYWDDTSGGYFTTSSAHEELLTRDKPSYDGAEPSGNSVAILNLLRLSELTSDETYRNRAERALSVFAGDLARAPEASPLLLSALESYLDTPLEIVIVTPYESADASPLIAVVGKTYLPNRVFIESPEGGELERRGKMIPLLAEKRAIGGKPTAFVCERGLCERPTADPSVLASQVRKVMPLERAVEPAD